VIIRRYWNVVLIALLGVVLSALAFNFINNHEHHKLITAFKLASISRVDAIERSIELNLAIIQGTKAFYESQHHVSRDSFQKFVTPIIKHNPAIRALEWIPKVSHLKRKNFENTAREEGFSDFNFTQLSKERNMVSAHKRAHYHPVYYVEPYIGNEAVLGFDLGSNPARLAALKLSRDTNQLVSSKTITLVQTGEPGILIFNPIYNGDGALYDKEQRELNLRGHTLGVIQVNEIIKSAYSSHVQTLKAAGIDFYIFDKTIAEDVSLVFIHSSRVRTNDTAPTLTKTEALSGIVYPRTIDVGGREWLIIGKPVSETIYSKIHWQAWSAILTGFAITTFLCLLLIMNTNRRTEVETLVKSRTIDLNDSKNRVSAIVENTADCIITIDAKGIIESANTATEKLFDYNSSELIGNHINMLLPPGEREEHAAYLAKSELHASRIINQARDLEGCHKNGNLFPIELNVSFMEHQGERKYIGILRDITARKQAENMKNEFISTVSHELRTPLTSIKGALGLIRGGSAGEFPQKMNDMLSIAYNNSDRLVRLINDILDVEKIEAGKMEYRLEPIDVKELLELAIKNNESYAEVHHAKFLLKQCPENIRVMGDSDRLMQVLTNLLSNAAKFSPDGSDTELSMEQRDEIVRIKVSDHGSGIPVEFRGKIFGKFSQADTSNTRQIGGTGLGLNISRAIIDHHGGKIDFETELGKGTTFYFDLPLISANKTNEDETSHDNKFRILICEDEPDIATLLSLILGKEGYSTDIARSASEAMELLSLNTYSAMTLDIALPDKDGISLLKDIRANPEMKDLPVIVISATARSSSNTIVGDAIGILDWLEKPIDHDRLSTGLRQAIWHSHNTEPSILHVEDDPDVLTIVSTLVDGMASITPVATFSEAKNHLNKNTYDLVILDLMLPGGDGEDLLPLLNNENGVSTPVIIFSAKEIPHETANSVHAALVKSQTSNEELTESIRSVIETLMPRIKT
jgi:PAS domain S-box-containing protein